VIVALSAVYLVLAASAFVHRFGRTLQLARDGTVTPFETLERRAERQAEAAAR